MSVQEEFQTLVDAHYTDVWAFASYCMMGSADVEDIVQDAFLVACERLKEGKGFTGDPGHWLKAVVRNMARARWRKERRMLPAAPESIQSLVQEIDRPLDDLVRAETHATLSGCLGKLPDAEKELIDARYNMDESPDRLAEEKDMNAKTLRVRLFRIRKKLKHCLDKNLPGWCEL